MSDSTDCDRYRAALRRIADAESGYWGRVAHEALHPSSADARSFATGKLAAPDENPAPPNGAADDGGSSRAGGDLALPLPEGKTPGTLPAGNVTDAAGLVSSPAASSRSLRALIGDAA